MKSYKFDIFTFSYYKLKKITMEENRFNDENLSGGNFNNDLPPMNGSQTLPNSVGILVMGILSIVLCWCYGIIGIALSIISLVLAKKAKELYDQNPGMYSESSFKNMKSGRILSFIGLGLSAAYILFIIVYIVFLGAALTQMPWQMY